MADWIIQDFGATYGSSSSSSSMSMAIGTVVWGNVEGVLTSPMLMNFSFEGPFGAPESVEEDFAKPFTGNWTLENIAIDGAGNSEIMVLGRPGYGISEIWKTGPGSFYIFKNKYGSGAGREELPQMEYRTSASFNEIENEEWIELISKNVTSLGYLQVRVVIGASVSSSSSSRSSSSSSSSSSSRSSSSSSYSSSSSSSSRSSSSSSSSYAVYFTFDEVQPTGQADPYFWGTSISNDSNVLSATSLRLYISTDGGANWNERQPLGDTDNAWISSAISSDGTVIVAASLAQYNWPTGRLFVSTNSGSTWTERRPRGDANYAWYDIAVSGNGSVILAYSSDDFGDEYLHRSTDGGVNWQEIIPGGTRLPWNKVICDYDGSVIIAMAYDRVYISTDSGNTWFDRKPVVGVETLSWRRCVINSTGSVIAVGAVPTGNSSDANGKIYVSTDFGVTWTPKQYKVMTGTQYTDLGGLVINESGSIIIVSISDYWNGSQYAPANMRISIDGGNTWSDLTGAPNTRYKSYEGGTGIQKLFGTQYYTGDYSNYVRPYIGRRGT